MLVPGLSALVCLLSLLGYLVTMQVSVKDAAVQLARGTSEDSLADELEKEATLHHPQDAPWQVTQYGALTAADGAKLAIRGRLSAKLVDGTVVRERSVEFESEAAVLEVLRQTPSLAIP